MKAKLLVVTTCALVSLSFPYTLQSAETPLSIDQGHNLLSIDTKKPAVEIGEALGDFSFRDVEGKGYYLHDLLKAGPTVLIFSSTECPLARNYVPRLNRLHRLFINKGVKLFGIFSNEGTTQKNVIAHAREMKVAFPVVTDFHGYLARKLGAEATPQVFVVNTDRTLVYRGAIDDHRYIPRVKNHFLKDALLAILAKKDPPVQQTRSLGCTIHLPTSELVEKVTYNRHISRILQDSCVKCHRPGQVAPFSLTSYQQARRWGKEIKAYTHVRVMPPWKAEPGFGKHWNPQWLTCDELNLIARWVKEGMLEGEESDLPPAPRFYKGWSLGKPDEIITMPEEYELGAEGEDDYRHFIIPTKFGEDKFIRAIEVEPGNRESVHHVVAYVDTSGKARELDKADPGPGYTRAGGVGFKPVSVLGGWVPGYQTLSAPRGTGAWLPKGADIVLQVHYYRTGKVEKDRTKFALYFEKSPNPAKILLAWVLNKEFRIPAGAKRHKVQAELKLKGDVYALSVNPHMHLLGKEIKITAKLPKGNVIPLVWVRHWDFNWQMVYPLRRPLFLPKGTKLQVVAWYDNSTENPNNPFAPPKEVGWGEKTTDEMCIGVISLVSAADYSPRWFALNDPSKVGKEWSTPVIRDKVTSSNEKRGKAE